MGPQPKRMSPGATGRGASSTTEAEELIQRGSYAIYMYYMSIEVLNVKVTVF
jgi:hypothetical protein